MKKILPLVLILLGFTSDPAQTQNLSQEAEQLNIQAYRLYDRGQYLSAIESWKQALALYKKASLAEKVGQVTIEISQAQRFSGQGVAACSTLQRYLKAEPSLCIPANGIEPIDTVSIGSTENNAIAAMDFARILRNFGLFEQANLYANASLQSAKNNNLSELIPDLTISRANTQLLKLMFDRDQWSYQEKTHLTDIEATQLVQRFALVFNDYEQQIDSPASLEAKLKWLTTYQELRKQSQSFTNDTLQNYPITLQSKYISLLQDIAGFSDFKQFPPSGQLGVKYEIASILDEANQHFLNPLLRESSYVWIQNLISSAKTLEHQTYLASAYALLGEHYKSIGKPEDAIKSYLLASQNSQVTHPRYRWEHTVAKLYESLGNKLQADRFYNLAIASVENAQWNMSPLDQSVKTHFQESIRPIFNDFIHFQLNAERPDFSKVFSLRSQYTEQVVETYLDCGDIKTLGNEDISEIDPNAAIVSIFKVDKFYYTVLKTKDDFSYSKTNAAPIDKDIDDLLNLFAGQNAKINVSTLNRYVENLHKKLLTQILEKVKPEQTILFSSIEQKLQQIPMGLLYDGETYLIERHPIALIGNTLYKPKEFDSQSKVLFAGITEQSWKTLDFEDLPYVNTEAEVINPAKAILNQQFTISKLSAEINKNLPILHIATHGQFSSQAENTFLLAWNEKIGLKDLQNMVKKRTQANVPIELLILSACETASGDRLASLGLAGVSIKAGARSTLASLWQAVDESSPYFMERFYHYLRSGHSKAKSVQLAQIDMIQEGYLPYSWATYILMGSWL